MYINSCHPKNPWQTISAPRDFHQVPKRSTSLGPLGCCKTWNGTNEHTEPWMRLTRRTPRYVYAHIYIVKTGSNPCRNPNNLPNPADTANWFSQKPLKVVDPDGWCNHTKVDSSPAARESLTQTTMAIDTPSRPTVGLTLSLWCLWKTHVGI